MRNYENFSVWQSSRDLAVALHKATEELDDSVKHDLFQSVRQDSIATMTEIAIGTIKKNPVFIEHLTKATGHVFSCRSKLELALALQWIDEKTGAHLDKELRKLSFMIHGLQRSLKERGVA